MYVCMYSIQYRINCNIHINNTKEEFRDPNICCQSEQFVSNLNRYSSTSSTSLSKSKGLKY